MLQDRTTFSELAYPVDGTRDARGAAPAFEMTPADWAALSRFSSGDWVSNTHVDRLQSLGLIERVFGQPLLTRLGRATIGIEL